MTLVSPRSEVVEYERGVEELNIEQRKKNESLIQWFVMSAYFAALGNRESLLQLGSLAANFPLTDEVVIFSPILIAMRESSQNEVYDATLYSKITSIFVQIFPGARIIATEPLIQRSLSSSSSNSPRSVFSVVSCSEGVNEFPENFFRDRSDSEKTQ